MKLILKFLLIIVIITYSFQVQLNLNKYATANMFENRFLFDLWKGVPGADPKAAGTAATTAVSAANSGLTSPTAPSSFNDGYAAPLVEGWLTISSPIFKDTTKFPVFQDPDGTADILTSVDYTRINEKFNDLPVDKVPSVPNQASKDPNSPPGRSFFYFRLNSQFLYFSESKSCPNVLGSIDWKNQVEASSIHFSDIHCFNMVEKTGNTYKYCAQDNETAKKFVCKIQTILRVSPDEYCSKKVEENTAPQPPKPTAPGALVEKVITQPYILIPLAREQCNENWNYAQNGKNWKCLCAEGN